MAPRSRKEVEEGVRPDGTATLQMVIALARAYQALEQGVRPQLAERGLGLTEFAVLEVLYHKGALPLGELRDRILVTGASTTYVVKKLEERGLPIQLLALLRQNRTHSEAGRAESTRLVPGALG